VRRNDTDQTRPNAPEKKARIRTEENGMVAPRTHSNGLEVNISSGDLRKGWSGKRGFRGRSGKGARLERGPKDGEFDERHILQSPKGSDELGEEEETQRTKTGRV
jgi:hypothetical protein